MKILGESDLAAAKNKQALLHLYKLKVSLIDKASGDSSILSMENRNELGFVLKIQCL